MPTTTHMSKDDILEGCKNAKPTPGRNSMGCSESWYDPFFCMQQTFSEGQLAAMTEQELNNLYTLAHVMADAFY